MKIVFTLGQLSVGGAELRALRMFEGLREANQNFSASIYVISGKPGVLDQQFQSLGLDVVYGRPGFSGLSNLWRLLRYNRPDVFHTNVSTANGFYALVAKLVGTPLIISHYHGLNDVRPGVFHRVKAALGRFLTNATSHHVIGVCQSAQAFAKAPDAKWSTLYNGVDVPEFSDQYVTKDQLAIGYLGRISPEKNPHRSLDIIEAVLNDVRGRNARLRIAGTGSPEHVQALAEAVKARGLADRVELCGVTNRPVEFLQQCTVLLLPSHREGLPGTVLEALSAGTPVVASDLPGVREIANAVRGVAPQSLSAADHEWAELIFEAASSDRRAIAASFATSPFIIEHHVTEVIKLWRLDKSAASLAS